MAKDEWSRYNRLLGDAHDLIDAAPADHALIKRAILSAMKADKLLTAEKRASESLGLLIDLSTTPQALQEALSESAKDINTIDSLLAYNNEAYFNIVRAISSELELN